MIERDIRRKLYSGTSDGMTRAFELAVAPLVFGLVGYGLDRLIGIVPVLTIVFVVVGFGGTVVKLWYGYDLEMRKHDQDAAWSPKADRTGGTDSPGEQSSGARGAAQLTGTAVERKAS